jgi:histidinol dehydrogenase
MLKIFDLSNTNINEVYQRLKKRSGLESNVENAVRQILEDVRNEGDAALRRYALKFDRTDYNEVPIRISDEERKQAALHVAPSMRDIIDSAAKNIREYHEKQKRNSWFTTDKNGTLLGQLITPVSRVGVYVPGGTLGAAPLISTVLMTIIPAKIAGVERIVMVTPPGESGKVNFEMLYAAGVAGADEIYRVGGAQAIGALAYGTESIKPVHKIFGPGNIYVSTAKRLVFSLCGIDQFAGPSEILVFADGKANPSYIAADLLSQAEHDPMAAAVLVTDSYSLAEAVNNQIEEQIESLDKKEICKKSLSEYGCAVIVSNLSEGMDIVNEIAPEHLEICTENPTDWLPYVKNAGSVFLGDYSPESVGDYFAGPNHVLPTCGTAKFSSHLSVDDFVKKSGIISYSKKALMENGDYIMKFAEAEKLSAHARAVGIRLEDLKA